MRELLLASLFIAGLAVHAQSPAVSGTLTVDATKVTLRSASAVGYAGFVGSTGRLVSVLLSDKAPGPAEFAELTKIGAGERYVPGIFEGAWKSMHGDKALSGVSFSIDAGGKVLSNELLVGGLDHAFSVSPDDLLIELKSVSPRVVGRLRTKPALLDLGSHKVSLDATFDVAVTDRSK